ncbi:unnamed protein product [Rhodiola kirilowii]
MSRSGDGLCSCGVSRVSGNADSRPCSRCCRSKSSSEPVVGLDLFGVRDSEKLWRILISSAKAFSIGAGLKGGMAIVSVLAGLKRRKKASTMKKVGTVTNKEAVITAMKETLRYRLFLGTFAGTFVTVDEIVGALGGHRRTAKWRALLAGAIAGPSMLLTGHKTQHTSLAIWPKLYSSLTTGTFKSNPNKATF